MEKSLEQGLAKNLRKSWEPKLVVICGPTASGKSGLALALAQHLGGGILSADSRQVYRGFDIGTAKPSAAEQRSISHALVDICEPTQTLTLGDFQRQAQDLIAQIQASRACPLLVGGTGLYIKAVVRGLKIPRVPPQEGLRSQLAQLGQRHNYAQLRAVDPAAATKIHANDTVRTLRALEVFYVTGEPISSQQGELPPDYPILQIGLDCPANPENPGAPDLLTERIVRRTREMVARGLVEEVRGLGDRYGEDLPLLNTLGYAEMRQYLAGKVDLDTAIDLTALHTRQFAKRQRTWFRAIPEIEWFDANAPDLIDQVWSRVQRFLDY